MKTKASQWILLALTLVFFFVFYFLISIPYFSGDVHNHVVWGRSILYEGPKGFYARQFHDYSFPNYPPISMLSFAGIVGVYDYLKQLFTDLNQIPSFPSFLYLWILNPNVEISFLKIPAILPFILTGLVIFYFGKFLKLSFKKSFLYTLVFLLNPAFIYLAVVWGQNDFTQVLFILTAILLLLTNKYYWSVFFAGLSIISKQTVLLIWGLYLITIFKLHGILKSLGAVIMALALLWIAYIPFNEGSVIWPFTFYNETLRTTGLLVADNAINYWGLLSRFRPADSQEIILFLKLEYWGFLFFAMLFLPVLYKYFKSKFSKESFIYFLFLTSIIYFFTFTRMHERYIIFGVLFAQILMMINRKYWFNLVFFSILLFVNLYKGLLMPRIPVLYEWSNSVWFLSILAGIYLLLIAYNYYLFMFKLEKE